jgi:signal peptidase I
MKDGRLYINGNLVERQKLGRYIIREYTPLPQILKEYEETLPEGRKHRILEYSDDKAVVDNTPEFHVPANHYFMMGDNRDNSNDSRKDVGMVPFDNIEGRARFLFYSHDDTIRWYNPISWFTSIRWKRLFNVIR